MKKRCLKRIKFMMSCQKLSHLQTIITRGLNGSCLFRVIIRTRQSVKMSIFQGSSILKIRKMLWKFKRILDDLRLQWLCTFHLWCFSRSLTFLWFSALFQLQRDVEYAADLKLVVFRKDGFQWLWQFWLKYLTLFNLVCWQFSWLSFPWWLQSVFEVILTQYNDSTIFNVQMI